MSKRGILRRSSKDASYCSSRVCARSFACNGACVRLSNTLIECCSEGSFSSTKRSSFSASRSKALGNVAVAFSTWTNDDTWREQSEEIWFSREQFAVSRVEGSACRSSNDCDVKDRSWVEAEEEGSSKSEASCPVLCGVLDNDVRKREARVSPVGGCCTTDITLQGCS